MLISILSPVISDGVYPYSLFVSLTILRVNKEQIKRGESSWDTLSNWKALLLKQKQEESSACFCFLNDQGLFNSQYAVSLRSKDGN